VEGRGIDSIELFWDGKRWWITGANLWTSTQPSIRFPLISALTFREKLIPQRRLKF